MSNSFYRSHAPPELYVSARQFDPDWKAKLDRWTDDGARWRRCVPPSIAMLWGRLNECGRLVAFVMAHQTLRSLDEKRKAKGSVSRKRHPQRQLAPLPRAPFMVLRGVQSPSTQHHI